MKNLPPNVYMQSYLQKAGVRFNINVVDTMCKKGLGLSFYIFCLLFILLSVIYFTDNICVFPDKGHFYFLSLLVVLYLALYIIMVVRFRILRSKLREDNAPIVVEAYAIVLFDLSSQNCEKIVKPKKSAILYKECGSKKPRFFTGVVKNKIEHHYYKDQIARVFIDRKHPRFYSVDDDKFYKTVSEKLQKEKAKYEISALEGKLNAVSVKKEK